MKKYLVIVFLLSTALGGVIGLVAGMLVRSPGHIPTPEDMQRKFEFEATQYILRGLEAATFAARLEEARKCPCYDVIVTTTPESVIVYFKNDRCKDIE